MKAVGTQLNVPLCDDMEEVKRVFAQLDTDSSGNLSRAEFHTLFIMLTLVAIGAQANEE
jgi:hypothetical protein